VYSRKYGGENLSLSCTPFGRMQPTKHFTPVFAQKTFLFFAFELEHDPNIHPVFAQILPFGLQCLNVLVGVLGSKTRPTRA